MGNFVSKEIRRLMGKAIYSRQMIEDGDHVLVAVSGGKDSMSLLCLLRDESKEYPLNTGSRRSMWIPALVRTRQGRWNLSFWNMVLSTGSCKAI